jgi:hypothetical protein
MGVTLSLRERNSADQFIPASPETSQNLFHYQSSLFKLQNTEHAVAAELTNIFKMIKRSVHSRDLRTVIQSTSFN